MAWKGKPHSVNHKVVASEKCISPRMICGHVRDKDSIFPASEWNYNDTATFCKGFFGVESRPNWITAEFGGHVSASFSIALRAGMLYWWILKDKLYFLAGAHHVDLRFATGEDPKWLQDVGKGEVSIIAEWPCHLN
ncbi:hypothetical protein POTOM_052707 [Populus tomentosa]|uniref:Uncharacterized protein n=1 Tax=Populus tomentosa TaxID=118781 RepID=A0A8X7Y8L0_POPTO|nr:hypothetical protein POTOM_052707 [Populus tomentosa]